MRRRQPGDSAADNRNVPGSGFIHAHGDDSRDTPAKPQAAHTRNRKRFVF
jgi:hypothetical protein